MVQTSVLANCLKNIINAERANKRQVIVRPSSNVIVRFLGVMQKKHYIGAVTVIDDKRAGKVCIELLGRLNKCAVINPRYDIKVNDLENLTTNLLPSRQFGHVVLTTSRGIMDHEEARKYKTGGKVLGYFF